MKLSILDKHRIIEQDVQKMGFFAYKDLESEEVDIQINRQIGHLVNGILDKHFGRALKIGEKQGFQANQVTLDNLRTIHGVHITNALGVSGNTVTINLPSNYYHHIKTKATITYKCYENDKEITKTENVAVRIENSQMDVNVNPFRKTGRDSILGEILGNFMVMTKDDTFEITSVRMEYIKTPAVVKYAKVNGNYDEATSVQCDLDSSLHYMLVDMTSIRIMEILESNQQKIVNLKQEVN